MTTAFSHLGREGKLFDPRQVARPPELPLLEECNLVGDWAFARSSSPYDSQSD